MPQSAVAEFASEVASLSISSMFGRITFSTCESMPEVCPVGGMWMI